MSEKITKVPAIRFKGFTDPWEQRKLGELMDVTSVKRIHQSDWTDKGIRFLRARDIVSASKNEEPADILYISEEQYNEYSKISGKVSQGDLLVTGVGSIGVPLLITNDNPLYFKDGNIIWFKNEHKIEGNFFYYSFINNKIQKYVQDVAGIGTVGTYTIDSGKKTPILLPSYDEQAKIGSFFMSIDTAITLQQRELDLMKKQKQTLLSKMFPKTGEQFPEIRFKGFTDPWEQCKLDKLTSLVTKGTTPIDKSGIGSINFVKIENIDSSSGEITITSKISEEEHTGYLRRSQLQENDILFSIAGTLGRVTTVNKAILPANTNQALAIIRLKSECLSYITTYLKGKAVADFVRRNPTVGAQPNLSLGQVGGLLIALPSIGEQQQIGKFFNQLDNLITLQQRKLDQMKIMKKSLLKAMFVEN